MSPRLRPARPLLDEPPRAGGRWRWAAPLLSLWLGGCGAEPPAGPPLPMGKVPPSLPRSYRQRTLAEWLVEARSADPTRRAAAPFALAELLTEADALRAVLEPLLTDPDAGVRCAAVGAVARVEADLGPRVAEHVVALLGAPEPGTARAARAGVERLGERAVPALIRGLEAEPSARRERALRALTGLGPAAAGAASALLKLVEREGPDRSPALSALEALGAAGLAPVAARMERAGDEEAVLLLGVLARLGAGLAPEVARLIAALDREGPVRRAAGEALLEAGEAVLAALDSHAASKASSAPAAADLAQRIREAQASR